ncbi:bactericidal permeability-increasing protein-like [Corticium candelabrum]|uniref:bactericidal permeability-increasing protein-like n=1 Tax=Corticium candelabrum TaxID=121492 RepID=UPI002E268C36|nr:bactericidal permeability-increasing protein-like [Corticium candelabrum]
MAIIGGDSSGRPALKALDCTFDIGSIDIHFHGSDFDWLYNLFTSQVAGFIKSSIRSKVCPLAVNAINEQGIKALESLPGDHMIQKVNFCMCQILETPFQPPPLPPPSPTNFMLTLWLTNYIANTAGYVFWEAGTLQINVTPNMLPKDIPFPLNTSTFKNMVPTLYARYSNKAMQLFINATSAPAITGTPKGLNLTATGDVVVSVILDKTVAPAFTVRVTIYARQTFGFIKRNKGSPEWKRNVSIVYHSRNVFSKLLLTFFIYTSRTYHWCIQIWCRLMFPISMNL